MDKIMYEIPQENFDRFDPSLNICWKARLKILKIRKVRKRHFRIPKNFCLAFPQLFQRTKKAQNSLRVFRTLFFTF